MEYIHEQFVSMWVAQNVAHELDHVTVEALQVRQDAA